MNTVDNLIISIKKLVIAWLRNHSTFYPQAVDNFEVYQQAKKNEFFVHR